MNIRNILIAAGSALALSALAGGALASGSVSATANASVTVVSPTTLTKTQDMVFGTVVRPTAPRQHHLHARHRQQCHRDRRRRLGGRQHHHSAKFNIVATAGHHLHADPDADLRPDRPDQHRADHRAPATTRHRSGTVAGRRHPGDPLRRPVRHDLDHRRRRPTPAPWRSRSPTTKTASVRRPFRVLAGPVAFARARLA